ncbi:peptidylprolyl isomerase [Malaciobacter halophilus]|uniref:Peptidylprolyl isomerase n=1 Tax=Malaciobacter halophilus TaxID=197482 RepID=A0A2N1J6J2_9BACT|nr:peptidylprolyl isomerase [Malaciobacter halophilus]AXH09971.1 putative periplasmic folding chaperone [Malaciobacter halophilus]PKI82188.1 peptidylprolyl isomerase [Malaciobacter halophilus]
MITWMQRHKKWLVSTIWISTIAFVGAGFVGWGSYDFGKQGGAVAVVGDREISVSEYQREYSTLYEQYSRIFGKDFNQEMADKLKLKDLAYKMSIEKNLILSYADELGLQVTDEDIAKELLKYDAFIKNGKFDKDTYIKVLNRNGTTATEFEDSLKRSILLQKIEGLFQVSATNTEVKLLNQLLFLEDNIDIKILDANSIVVKEDDNKIKEYWEKNKANYLSDNSYDFDYAVVDVKKANHSLEDMKKYYENFKTDFRKENDKIKNFEEAKDDVQFALDLKDTKRDALKEYIKYKKNQKEFTKNIVLFENQLPYGKNNTIITKAKAGDLKKPFLHGDKYIIVKLNKKMFPKQLTFEQAKAKVTQDFINNEKSLKLKALSKKELDNFKGTNIGWVSRSSISKVSGLNQMEASQFLEKLFNTETKKGEVRIGNKVVLFKINDSRFANYEESRDASVKQTLENLQNSELMNNLIKRLENRYEIQSSLEIKE